MWCIDTEGILTHYIQYFLTQGSVSYKQWLKKNKQISNVLKKSTNKWDGAAQSSRVHACLSSP